MGETEVTDPMVAIQNIIGALDPNAMVSGVVVIAEWVEPDGSGSLTILHTPMAPWHVDGLLSYATPHVCGGIEPYDEDDED